MAFGLLDQPLVPRLTRILANTLLVAATAGTIGLAFLSFTRKVETFNTAGFSWARSGGALRITSVAPDGAAAKAGLRPGDRVVLADGQMAASLERPEKILARKPFPHHLVVLSGSDVPRSVELGKPSVRLDRTYLFLAFVGFLYLLIGLFTAARERGPAARVFWALCLSTFAVYVITPGAADPDSLWKASWLAEDFFRALLPALLLHLFLIFPRPIARGRALLPLLYLPAAAYAAAQAALLAMRGPDVAAFAEAVTRFWLAYFAIYGSAVVARLAVLLTRQRADPEAEKQVRWIGLGVAVGLSPFLILSVLPRIFGFESPLLSSVAVVPLVLVPLAFSYAILKWRLWDVEIFVREALATTATVLLGGMTFVLLNALLDRTLEGMAEAGKNVISFGSGILLASLLVPVKKRITGVLERFQYHDTYRARRALLDIARDFATPRPRKELAAAIVKRIEEGLNVVPCSLFLFEEDATPENALLSRRLEEEEITRLRGASFGPEEPPAAKRLHSMGYRAFFAMRCGGSLVGALGVGHKDGRLPLSSEDEGLLTAVMAQAGLAYENARLYGALADRLEEIRALQQYQESVIRSSSSGIVVLDSEDRIHSANPAFSELVGGGEKELQGLLLSEVLPGIDPGAPSEGEEERVLEASYRNLQGDERDLRISVSAFQGVPDRRVVLVDDVTDRLRAERAVAERERLASLGVLAAGVAHEVNTPIAGLSSYAQMLLKDTDRDDPRYAILKKMERQTFRAAHLVNNLIEFARPRPRSLVRTDLREVIANAAESVETTFQARKIALEWAGNGEPVCVMGDPRELEQVLVNLFSNARDASPDGGTVSCVIERNDGSAAVVVADRGAGLPLGSSEKFFQPFFSTKRSGGTGLGLAISREIVLRHGGEIVLTPRPGGGLEARVTLPVAEEKPS
jgi:PAS domain S-box-containing protein